MKQTLLQTVTNVCYLGIDELYRFEIVALCRLGTTDIGEDISCNKAIPHTKIVCELRFHMLIDDKRETA